MKIRVLGAYGAEGLAQRPSAFLVDDTILIDGGTVGGALSTAEQIQIEHALITHSHLDHVAGLAFLTETLALYETRRPLTIASLEPVVKALRTAVFNDTVWPDFSQVPTATSPIVRYRTLIEDAEQAVAGLVVTPIAVNHTVPCSGFILHDGTTDALWKAARKVHGLGAVILECAFPNRLSALADVAKHMTPERIRRELDKLPGDLPVLIYHVKPQFKDEIGDELGEIAGHRISFAEQDKTYLF